MMSRSLNKEQRSAATHISSFVRELSEESIMEMYEDFLNDDVNFLSKR